MQSSFPSLRRRSVIPLLLAGIPLLRSSVSSAQAKIVPEIWFCPMQNAINPGRNSLTITKHDFLDMIKYPGQWKQAASHISELTLDVVHFVEQRRNLRTIIDWANSTNIKIGGSGSIVPTDHACNPHMEGITNDVGYAREAVATFHGWKQAGGRLDYFIMDGPFYFGYYATQKECHFSVEDVAARAAGTMQKILQDYPNVKIVDAEGPGPIPVSKWLTDYDRFLTAFRKECGRPVDYLSMDMHWIDAWHTGYNWVNASRQTIAFAHARKMKVGLFINADDNFVETKQGVPTNQRITAEGWMQENREHMQTAHGAGLELDFLNITSWMKFPKWNLPESNPDAYTSLVNAAYSLWST